MLKVEKIDLNSTLISSMISSLEFDFNDCESLIAVIEEFITEINSSVNLKGESYKMVATKLSEYNEILEKRKLIASNLQTAIKDSNKRMVLYMDDDDILDTTELENLKLEIEQVEQNYDNAKLNYLAEQSRIKDKISQNSFANSGMTLSEYNDFIYGDSNYFSYLMSKYEKIILDMKKMIEKLEGLAGEDSSSYGLFDFSNSQLTAYKGLVNSLQQSSISSL